MGQTVLIFGVLGLPIAVAIWLALNENGPPGHIRWTLSLTAGVTTLCALGLLPFAKQAYAEQAPLFAITWLPTAGPMHLSLATTSLYAMAATAAAAAVIYLMVGLVDVNGDVESETGAAYTGALTLIALAAGNLAFLSGHFLLRYVALEVVGLCIAAAPLLEKGGRERFIHAGWIYLLLRFGDAGLLTAILLLGAESGTFEISAALDAVATLPTHVQIWINLGFFLAVAVKIGLGPFYAWIDSGRRLARSTYIWLYATLMPNLGLYLLYRVAGLPTTVRPLHSTLLVLGVGAGMLTLFILTQRPSPAQLPTRSASLLATLLWCAALLGDSKLAWWGLLALTLIRLPFYLGLPRREGAPEKEATETSPVAPWKRWDQSMTQLAQRLRGDVEVGVLERGQSALAGGLSETARYLHATIEVGIFERGLEALAEGLSKAATYLHTTIEQQSLEGLLRKAVRTTRQGSRQMQGWHTGRLRANLWWVILCLVLAIGFVLGS